MKHVLPQLGLILVGLASHAQTGTVAGFQKISETQGNLNTSLANQGLFGYVSETESPGLILSGAPFDGNGSIYLIQLNPEGSVETSTLISSDDFGQFEGLSGAQFGMAAADMNDYNNDGFDDYLIGAPNFGAQGGLFILSETESGYNLLALDLPVEMASALKIGSYLAKDGNQYLTASAAGTGSIFGFNISVDNIITTSFTIDASHQLLSEKLDTGDLFGSGLSTYDMNGDGNSDIICGAPGDDDQDTNFGAVYMLYRDDSGNISSIQKLSRLEGDFGGFMNIDDGFGMSVRSIGDLDENGVPDLAVGAPGDDDGGFDIGAVWILFMRANGTVQNEKKINRLEGNFTGDINMQDKFGTRITTLGDYNGDGTIDLLVGSVEDDDGGTNKGAVFTIFIERCPAPSGFFEFEVEGPTVSFTAEGGPGYSHIWNFDDGGYSQNQNPVHTYESTGNYWVCLAINSGCGGDNYCRNVQVSTVTSVAVNEAEQISIFPNPANEFVSIRTNSQSSLIRFFDITGKPVLEQVPTKLEERIEISSLNKGVYLIEITGAKGSLIKKLSVVR